MATINQLVRKPRAKKNRKDKCSGIGGLSSKAWCLYAGLYNNAQKT